MYNSYKNTLSKGIIATIGLFTCLSSAATPDVEHRINNTAATPINNYSQHQALSPVSVGPLYVWQGFEHEWQRFVVLRESGRVPHRISKFHNFIQQPDIANDAPASFNFSQSTGVDGNYMNPKGNYSVIDSESIATISGSISMQWTDELNDAEYATANNSIRETISIPLEEFPRGHNQQTIILQGIQLDLECDNNKQPMNTPCNSNGMWPYVFNIDLGQCILETHNYICELNVDIYRAWTPNKGGFQLPPIIEEIKPLNHKLDYSLQVHFSVISANGESFSHLPLDTISVSQDIHKRKNKVTNIHYQEDGDLNNSIHAIRSFGFALSAPELLEQHWSLLGSDIQQQGRYIGKLTNKITDAKQPDQTYSSTVSQSVWAPVTVVNATSHTYLSTQRLMFDNNASVTKTQTVKGKLCINSTDQAPAFSRWTMCNIQGWLAKIIYGGKEQLSHSVELPSIVKQ